MRPVAPSSLPLMEPKIGLALHRPKPPSLLGSPGAGQGQVGGSFGHLLHDPQGTNRGHGQALHPARARPEAKTEEHPPRRLTHDEPALDPSTRHAAQLAPPLLGGSIGSAGAAISQQVEARVRSSLEDLLPSLVRRVAWSGDGRRGAVRLELGAGELAGGTLLVQVDDGRVRVRLTAPPGMDVAAWRGRIADRLAARGLVVDAVEGD